MIETGDMLVSRTHVASIAMAASNDRIQKHPGTENCPERIHVSAIKKATHDFSQVALPVEAAGSSEMLAALIHYLLWQHVVASLRPSFRKGGFRSLSDTSATPYQILLGSSDTTSPSRIAGWRQGESNPCSATTSAQQAHYLVVALPHLGLNQSRLAAI